MFECLNSTFSQSVSQRMIWGRGSVFDSIVLEELFKLIRLRPLSVTTCSDNPKRTNMLWSDCIVAKEVVELVVSTSIHFYPLQHWACFSKFFPFPTLTTLLHIFWPPFTLATPNLALFPTGSTTSTNLHYRASKVPKCFVGLYQMQRSPFFDWNWGKQNDHTAFWEARNRMRLRKTWNVTSVF